MSVYKYTVVGRDGDVSKGIVDAANAELATQRLRERGLNVVKVSRDWTQVEITESKVSQKELIVFTRQMATMIDAGLPLTQILSILYETALSKKMRTTVQQVTISLESGDSLGAAIGSHPEVFPDVYRKLIVAGQESGGNLGSTLNKLADHLEREAEIRSRVKSAFISPMMIAGVTVIALLVLYTFVLPSFEEMFMQMETLPFITSVNLEISRFLRENPWHVGIGALSLVGGCWYAVNNPITRRIYDRWSLKIPLFGTVIQRAAIARFTGTLSTLLASGVKLLDAMLLCGDTAGNIVVKESVEVATRAVMEGQTLAEGLKKGGEVFPILATALIRVGEQTGHMEEMLERVAAIFEREVHEAVDRAVEMINPITTILLGCIVGLVLISVYMPLFSVMTSFAE